MIKFSNHVYSLQKPSSQDSLLPVVFDSPHSGMDYPFNSGIIAPAESLNSTWDAFVNELWQAAPTLGAPLLAARFPCAYIDPDCSPDDIDAVLIEESWPTHLTTPGGCHRSMGLIRTSVQSGIPMYRGKLPSLEVQRRVSQYYAPYHQRLRELVDLAHATFGQVWHISCRSLKAGMSDAAGNAGNGRIEEDSNVGDRPQIIISDFKGSTASSEFTEWVAGQFDALGYRTLISTAHYGGYIVRHYGAPMQGRHSVQIDIRRSLYMDEKTFEKTDNFSTVQRDLDIFMMALSTYVQKRNQNRA